MFAELEAEPSRDVRIARTRVLVEADFWAFCRLISSFGRYKIRDEGHPRDGGLWIEEPFVFDRCREIQEDWERRNDDVFYNWARFSFKTELITKNQTLWLIAKDPLHTTCIITNKVDQVGEMMFSGITDELVKNKRFNTHWPKVFPKSKDDYPAMDRTSVTVLRPAGPKEPTVSIHGLAQMPSGGHYNRIVVDDAVVQTTVQTPRAMLSCARNMRRVAPLAKDDAIVAWVGTIWDNDDPNMQGIRDSQFRRRSFHPGYKHPEGLEWSGKADTAEWEPVLRSRRFLEEQRRKLGEYEFSCQIMGTPIARSEQSFDWNWVQLYDGRPREEAKGCKVHVFMDGAKENKTENDYWVFRVTGFREDGNIYQLDMWREKLMVGEALDLLFAIVRFWKPVTVWPEEFGANDMTSTIKREQEARKYRFKVKALPAVKRTKENRIRLIETLYRAGQIWYPRNGFGHGSGPRFVDLFRLQARDPAMADERVRPEVLDATDTMLQFKQEEFLRWTPVKGSIKHDDMLDCEAWLAQPEIVALLPMSRPEPRDETEIILRHPDGSVEVDLHRLIEERRRQQALHAAASEWVF